MLAFNSQYNFFKNTKDKVSKSKKSASKIEHKIVARKMTRSWTVPYSNINGGLAVERGEREREEGREGGREGEAAFGLRQIRGRVSGDGLILPLRHSCCQRSLGGGKDPSRREREREKERNVPPC